MDERVKAALARGGIIDMTTTGRKSGQPRRIEIVFHNVDGRVYISGFPRPRKRRWLANLEANPRFTFHLKRASSMQGSATAADFDADLPATARPITDEAERRRVLAQVARTWDRSDIDEMVRYSPLVEVTFEE